MDPAVASAVFLGLLATACLVTGAAILYGTGWAFLTAGITFFLYSVLVVAAGKRKTLLFANNK